MARLSSCYQWQVTRVCLVKSPPPIRIRIRIRREGSASRWPCRAMYDVWERDTLVGSHGQTLTLLRLRLRLRQRLCLRLRLSLRRYVALR